MNILVFSWRDPKHPLAGGAEQVMHQHMKGWVKAGHSVTLFSSKTSNLPDQEDLDGVKIKRSGYQYLGVQLAGFWFYLRNRQNFDLVVDQFHGIPFFTPFYVNNPKLAVVQEVAREVWFMNHLPKPFNWLIGMIGYYGERYIYSLYRNINFLTGSLSAKKEIEQFGISSNHITIVPHGVILARPRGGLKKEKKPTVVFLGVLSKDKGIEDALTTFQLLARNSYQFWVIGRPETKKYQKKIYNLVKKLDLEKSVKFWGYVSPEKKFELLARAHILVNPSVREGWGLVNIEANVMKTPIVSYFSPGLVDSVKDGLSGLIVKQNTPKALATTIEKIINDRPLFQTLSLGAQKWGKKFSWNNSQKMSLVLVEKLVR